MKNLEIEENGKCKIKWLCIDNGTCKSKKLLNFKNFWTFERRLNISFLSNEVKRAFNSLTKI